MSEPAASSTPATLHKIARACLDRSRTIFPPQTRAPQVRQALLACAHGLRHYEGEHVVACQVQSRQGEGFWGVILTDRVLAARFEDEREVIALEQLAGASIDEGLLETRVVLETREGRKVELPVTSHEAAQELVALVGEVVASGYRPGGRAVPAVVTAADDPAGVRQLVASLKDPDVRVVGLLQLLHEEMEAGRIQARAGLDLAVRLHALNRTLSFGRGATEGGWVTPLRQDDLAFVLPSLFEHEVTRQPAGTGIELQVHLVPPDEQGAAEPRRARAGGGLAGALEERLVASLIDNVIERTVGDAVYKFLGQGGADALRILIDDGPDIDDLVQAQAREGQGPSVWQRLRGGLPGLADQLLGRNRRAEDGALTVFRFEGRVARQWRPLADLKPSTVAELLLRLEALEVEALIYRVLKGWGESPEALLGGGQAGARALLVGREAAPLLLQSGR